MAVLEVSDPIFRMLPGPQMHIHLYGSSLGWLLGMSHKDRSSVFYGLHTVGA